MLGPRYGVRWTPSSQLSHREFHTTGDFSRQGVVGSLLPEFREVTEAQTPFRGYEFARQFDTMLIEPPIYLTALTQDFEIATDSREGQIWDRKMLEEGVRPKPYKC